MNAIHDTDPVLLLAITHASKRKPADFEAILLALSIVQSTGASHSKLPTLAKLIGALQRLCGLGLIAQTEDCFYLTSAAQELMAGLPKKTEVDETIFRLKEKLAFCEPAAALAEPIAINESQLAQAISAFNASLPPPRKKPLLSDTPIGKTAARKWDYSRPGPRKTRK